jgi:hypothetical protein
VALIDDVESIEEIGVPVPSNFVARGDLRIERNVPSYKYFKPGFTVTQEMYDGKDEIVVVTDSGFDKGNLRDVHDAFQDRIVDLYNVAGAAFTQYTMDKMCHGTPVCGSVAANYRSEQFGPIRGTAPKAGLIVQSISGSDGKLLSIPCKTIFSGPYNRYSNARIYSNSWDTKSTKASDSLLELEYGAQSKIIDEWMYANKDLLVLNSAGNRGIQKPSTPSQIANQYVHPFYLA